MRNLIRPKMVIIFISLVCFQLFVIGHLVLKVITNKNKVLSYQTSVIDKKRVTYTGSTLNYFYEPVSNAKWEDNFSWLSYKPSYHINYDALNSLKDYPVVKSPKSFRIITLGDSFVYGAYVNTQDNWPSVLEGLFNKNCSKYDFYEVINLGMNGYELEYTVERYDVRGKKYNPDLVIWLTKNDDIEQINELIIPLERRNRERMKIYPPQNEYFILNGESYPTWKRAMKEFDQEYDIESVLSYQKKVLERFRSLYQGEVLAVNFNRFDYRYKQLLEIINSASNLKFYAITSIGDKNDYLPDTHLSALGNKKFANEMFDYLSSTICK